MTYKVFVYGSLKRGYHNNPWLKDAKFIGEYKTPPKYTMYNLGAFPGVMENGSTSIQGEIYEIDKETLQSLDILEGVRSGMYYRKNIMCGKLYGEAWIYFASPKTVDTANDKVVADGHW